MTSYSTLRNFSFLILLLACSGGDLKRKQLQEGTAQEFGQISEYFLPLIPKWIDFSTTGQCFRGSEVHYLNYRKLHESYSYNYEQIIQLQGLFNDTFSGLQETKATTLEDRNATFYEVVEKMNGGVKYISLPEYDRFYLVWIDRMNKNELEKWLEQYRESDYMNQGVPVLLSFCYTKSELLKQIDLWDFEEDYPHVITSEAFSIYNEDFNQGPRFFANLTSLFPKKSEVYFVAKEVNQSVDLKQILFQQGFKRIPFN